MLGQDTTSDRLPLDRVAAVLGEFGVKDHGTDDVADPYGDSTNIAEVDAKFLADLAAYMERIKSQSGNAVSWFMWAWNANSRERQGDEVEAWLHSLCCVSLTAWLERAWM
jgi:hypothetical protein